MIASRGMGAIKSSKMPSGTKKARRDDTDFTEYAGGGKVATNWIKGAIKKPGALRKSDRKSTRLNSSHIPLSRMPSSA